MYRDIDAIFRGVGQQLVMHHQKDAVFLNGVPYLSNRGVTFDQIGLGCQ